MSTFSPAFSAHLASPVTTLCHCWRLTRRDGEVSGFTDHDRLLRFENTEFKPETGFSASEARETLGLAVDTVDVEGALSSLSISEEDVADGLYDGARIETFLVNWRKPEERGLIRAASVGRITRSGNRFVAELQSLTQALDRPQGRFITRTCDAELGDGRCRVALDNLAYRGTGEIAAIEPLGILRVSGLGSYTADWFSKGVLLWKRGALAGRSVRIREHRRKGADVSLLLEGGTDGRWSVGDTFEATAGCDKTFATCKAKFNNPLNFRGFPHLPGNDRAYAYVTEDVPFDGAPLVP